MAETEAALDTAPSRTAAYRGRAHTPKTVIAGTIGNVMEWYDFALYGFFAPIIAQLFFPSHSKLMSLIATFGVFAAGFVMRPLGGVIFGYIGDRLGRATVLRISIVTMGGSRMSFGPQLSARPISVNACAKGVWGTGLPNVRCNSSSSRFTCRFHR